MILCVSNNFAHYIGLVVVSTVFLKSVFHFNYNIIKKIEYCINRIAKKEEF